MRKNLKGSIHTRKRKKPAAKQARTGTKKKKVPQTPEEIYNASEGPVIPANPDTGINRKIEVPEKLIEKIIKK